MPLLDMFKSEQQSFELIFPREGPFDTHPQRMDRFIEEPLPSTLGGFAIAWVFFDVRNQARIEDELPIVSGIKTAIEVEIGASQVHTHLFRHLLQRFQALRQQHHIRFIDGPHGDGS